MDQAVAALSQYTDARTRVDGLFNLEEGYFVIPAKRRGTTLEPAKQTEEHTEYMGVSTGSRERAAAVMMMTMNIQLNQTRLKAVHLNAAWVETVNEALRRGMISTVA